MKIIIQAKTNMIQPKIKTFILLNKYLLFLNDMISEKEFREYIQLYRNKKSGQPVSSSFLPGRYNTTYDIKVDASKLVNKHQSYKKNVNKMLKDVNSKNNDVSTYKKMNKAVSEKITKLQAKVDSIKSKV